VDPFRGGHEQSKFCREGQEAKAQEAAAIDAAWAIQQQFTAYGEELNRVDIFKYLGRLMSMDDNDRPAIRGNLKKARRCWARVSRVLRAENAPPRVSSSFYRATVQAVLLYGSETWTITQSMMRVLEGFHLKAAWRIATVNKPVRKPDGTWVYPTSEDVLEEVGLKTIKHYIEVRRQTIANYIVNRPIYLFCEDAERRRGSMPRLYWWEQSFDLDAARASDEARVAAGDEEEEESMSSRDQ
jgi:hypothetical protein